MAKLAFTGVPVGSGSLRAAAGQQMQVCRAGCACSGCVLRSHRAGCGCGSCMSRRVSRSSGRSVLRASAADEESMKKQIAALEKVLSEQESKLKRLEAIKDQEYMSRLSLVAQDDHKLVSSEGDKRIKELLNQNKEWQADMLKKDPEFFNRLKDVQTPEILWIGCSDSRVPANQILNLLPGEVFVTRNIANCVIHSDINCLSVMEFAVKYLKVKRIIVCGHYGCGGVKASMSDMKFGLIDNWLRHIRDVRRAHSQELAAIADEDAKFRRLCELNVLEQVQNVCATTIVQGAWDEGQDITVHAWIYDVANGAVKDLGIAVSDPAAMSNLYRTSQSA